MVTNFNSIKFQHRLYENYTVQDVISALVKNFGVAAVLHGVANATEQIIVAELPSSVCLCGADDNGEEH